MARLRVAKDGHRYLTHGYPVLDPAGRHDTQFSTYQLYPGAEWLFREARLEEGASIPRETFYALLVDGEIYNERRRSGMRITSVPTTVRDVAEQECSELDPLVRLKGIVSPNQSRRTIEWYKALTAAYHHPALRRRDRLDPSTCLSLASWYRLFRASQQ
jgi:hypothetical protein